MKSIINKKNVDTTKQPLFFGEGLNLQRYDKYRYKKLFDLFLQQLSFFWRPEEVDLSGKEKNDFLSLTEHEKFIFTKNLSYQILLDSVQGRGIGHLLNDCSNPELEAFAKAWEFSETIHSYSYTYIIKNVYPNPSEIFDEILTDKEVLKRTTSVTKYYDDLINGIDDKDAKLTLMGWEIVPDAYYNQIMDLKNNYGNPDIYLTENGAAYPDLIEKNGEINDNDRIDYFKKYLSAVTKSIDNGAKVKSYFAWTFMDNFEWALGFEKRFGIVHVDFKTLKRTPKKSYYFFKKLVEQNSIPLDF